MWQFWIDRGGTFTDIIARRPDGTLITCKLLSENPEHYADAALAGIRRILDLGVAEPIPAALVQSVKMGTTVATNALLQRQGARTLLVVNAGFADLLRIGDQTRPDLFDLSATRPEPLYEQVIEVHGRIGADGTVVEALDEQAAFTALAGAVQDGMEACAIALMHAWQFPLHEHRLAKLARDAGFAQVSVSHAVTPLLRLIPRAETTVMDAYLSPVLRRYVDRMATALGPVPLYFMQTHGGLTGAAQFRGKDAVLSGPAGGIVGAARTAEAAGFNRVIGFDMGGTSTDVALYDGAFEHTYEAEIAGIRLQTPMLAIHTIAAGGGSVLRFDGARFRVGPDSAGARPGPAAYRQGGPLTVTDANICVGRIQPRHFPAIFGAAGDAALDEAAVHDEFACLAARIGGDQDPRDVAEGFLRVAVGNMAGAIKHVSVRRGHDARDYALQCFGGAGGQLACLVADELGINTVLIHPLAGVLSAYGMGLADHSAMFEQAIERPLDAETLAFVHELADGLAARGRDMLIAQGADVDGLRVRPVAHLRLEGADAALAVELGDMPAMLDEFAGVHRVQFGFVGDERPVIVAAVAVQVTVAGPPVLVPRRAPRMNGAPTPIEHVTVWIAGRPHDLPVLDRTLLFPGDRVEGPALLREPTATTVIDPGWHGVVAPDDMLILRRTAPAVSVAAPATGSVDPVSLELFHALLMGAARQAGAVLQRTAQSVNIKERLDFSCALFDATGALVANAPHVPVHLGAMGESVRWVLQRRGATLRLGDSVALNDPYAGGTHLPDITVVTPVFDDDGDLCCVVASRAHHADIGGMTPGSTPPDSRTLEDEGVVIDDFLLVQDGVLRESAFRALLAGARYPARNPDINVADIGAQLAANEAAIAEMRRIAMRHGWRRVQQYMRHVMENGEASVRRLIGRLQNGAFTYRMDDRARLQVEVRVDAAAHCAVIDFSGTSPQHTGNFNAPPAVTRAVVLYVLRCMVGEDIPLNDGCLRPITLVIPAGSFLSPHPGAAVVAGNTEVSQAVCNALLGALGVAACSQATMNNLLFGDAHLQYYETICGGAGAGPGWHGGSAVQTHMTNTRMTDPEVLEMRTPVRVEVFAIRAGSGGGGAWRGGDGAVRRLRFLQAMTVVLVASRRTVAPFGLNGGAPGATGRQVVDHADGRRTVLGGVARMAMQPGDAITVETPGGGGAGGRPSCYGDQELPHDAGRGASNQGADNPGPETQ
jgi:5-oxoprolinase (ATP-hydrolysing)